ncbi:hypothetical protein BKA62DRAFT_719661, partial [Auriculariales sp. MPI-PUGE-AT-0066]
MRFCYLFAGIASFYTLVEAAPMHRLVHLDIREGFGRGVQTFNNTILLPLFARVRGGDAYADYAGLRDGEAPRNGRGDNLPALKHWSRILRVFCGPNPNLRGHRSDQDCANNTQSCSQTTIGDRAAILQLAPAAGSGQQFDSRSRSLSHNYRRRYWQGH